MGNKTAISWTDATWNPVRGCSRVSEGCRNCYAERVAARFSGPGMPYEGLIKLAPRPRRIGAQWSGIVRLIPDHLADPLRWKKSRRIFVNSMSDLFHEGLTNEEIAAVFGVMAAAPQHTFQVLTKRAKRMREWFEWARGPFTEQQRGIVQAPHTYRAMLDAAYEILGKPSKPALDAAWRANGNDVWPLPNVWLGVSVENQAAADERIPELLETPAAVRFLSCEPLIGPVTLDGGAVTARGASEDWLRGVNVPRVAWVIGGCESGPGARPCSVEWLRSLRDQCDGAGVPYFLKQAVEILDEGERVCDENGDARGCGERIRYYVHGPGDLSVSCGCTVEGAESANGTLPIGAGEGSKRKGGSVIELPYLDGVQHKEFPEVSRG